MFRADFQRRKTVLYAAGTDVPVLPILTLLLYAASTIVPNMALSKCPNCGASTDPVSLFRLSSSGSAFRRIYTCPNCQRGLKLILHNAFSIVGGLLYGYLSFLTIRHHWKIGLFGVIALVTVANFILNWFFARLEPSNEKIASAPVKERSKTRYAICIVASAVALIAIREFAARSLFALTALHFLAPFLPSDASLVRNLASSDKHLVYASLDILADRDSHSGTDTAKELMHSRQGWLIGAMYLGQVGDGSSIPYLIKGLKNGYASRLSPEVATDLKKLTGQNYGTNFQNWFAWWKRMNGEDSFDFDSNLGD